MQNYNKASRSVRIIVLIAFFLIAIFLFIARLVNMQVGGHDYYKEISLRKTGKDKVISTSRGEVYDRNGVKLISNSISQNIVLDKSEMIDGIDNNLLINLLNVLEEHEILLEDKLPLSKNPPYTLNEEYIWNEEILKLMQKFMEINELSKFDILGTKLYDYLYSRYDFEALQDVDEATLRKLCGFRFLLEAKEFSNSNPFVLIENADVKTTAIFAENKNLLDGVKIVNSYKRFYNQMTTAAQILGTTGPIYAEEAEIYKEKGYPMNAIVGKDGVEGAFEEYLRGIDGLCNVTYSTDGDIIGKEITKEPKVGHSIRLTIDSEMQKVAENALAKAIEKIKINEKVSGSVTGCAVVINPKNFEILTMANSKTFDMNTYRQNYNELLQDPDNPLSNRCIYGIYPPGSTYKIATAAAALDGGFITRDTLIYDAGIYKKYETYQPHCWLYDKHGTSHGYVNVVGALKESCNYFFYEVSDNMGIDIMTEYSKKLGLGENTGIEIGESTGILACPEQRKSVGKVWQPGDTIQASIGQSDHAFTPIQLASFLATVLNGGKRYKAHLLKSVDNFYDETPIKVQEPELLSDAKISDENLEILKYSMKTVVEEGTASQIFKNYEHSVGGKTGTAETGSGFDTASFIGFAPYDNPEIVISVIIERGNSGSNAANVAKEIFDFYYNVRQQENPSQPTA